MGVYLFISASSPVAGADTLQGAARYEGDAGPKVPLTSLELQGPDLANAAQYHGQHKVVQVPRPCKPCTSCHQNSKSYWFTTHAGPPTLHGMHFMSQQQQVTLAYNTCWSLGTASHAPHATTTASHIGLQHMLVPRHCKPCASCHSNSKSHGFTTRLQEASFAYGRSMLTRSRS